MRLDQIIPRTSIPAAAPYPDVSGAALSAPARTLERGAGELQRQSLIALDAAQRAEQAKRDLEIRTDAATLKALVQEELDTLDSSMRLAHPTDPDKYLTARKEAVQALVDELPNRVKYPETLRLLQPALPGILGPRNLRAQEHADKLFLGQRKAGLTQGLDTYTRLAANTALGADLEFARIYADAAALIDEYAPVLGPEAATQLRIKTREAFFNERARRHSQEDPEGFLDQITKYDGMDPDKRDTYTFQAKQRVLAAEKDRATQFENWMQRVEKEAEAEQERRLMALSDLHADGRLTVEAVRAERDLGTFKKRTDYEHYLKLATAEPKKERAESDQTTYVGLASGIRLPVPVTTATALNAALDAGLLTRKDWDALTKELAAKREGLKDEARAERIKKHGEEQEFFRAWLGVQPGMERLQAHDARVTLLAEIINELNQRALYGPEDPRAVGQDLRDRYGSRRQRAFRMTADGLRGLLAFPDVDEAGLKALVDAGRIQPEVYREELRKLKNLREAERRISEQPTRSLPATRKP